MARNLWKVIQKQEKKIEELEQTIRELSLRVACLEARDIKTTPYKFDKFDDHDWWKRQPIMANKLPTKEEIEGTFKTLELVDVVEKVFKSHPSDIMVEFNNPIAKRAYKEDK